MSAAKRRWTSAGNDSPAVTVARTESKVSDDGDASSNAAQKPGLEKNSVGCSVAIRSRNAGGVGGVGHRTAVAPTENGNVSELPSP